MARAVALQIHADEAEAQAAVRRGTTAPTTSGGRLLRVITGGDISPKTVERVERVFTQVKPVLGIALAVCIMLADLADDGLLSLSAR
jgi:hypothetical protein